MSLGNKVDFGEGWVNMARKYIIVAVNKDLANEDDRYMPRFGPFPDEASALQISKRLNQGASSTNSLANMPAERRAPEPDHSNLLGVALEVLRSYDPAASANTRYVVRYIDSFAPPTEGPAPSVFHDNFRRMRDMGT